VARLIFLAAPSSGAGALALIESLVRELQVVTGGALRGSDIFVPHIQVGDVGIEVDAPTFAARTLAALDAARVVVAVLDGAQVDDQVALLVGRAHARGVPVVGYATDGRSKAPLVEAALAATARDVHALSAALARVLAPQG
jgi:nucleoside 2-deoxyribosyltransferase